jgi:hypothetical protein
VVERPPCIREGPIRPVFCNRQVLLRHGKACRITGLQFLP